MSTDKKTNRKTLKMEIYGRTRIVRDVREDEPKSFFAYYRNCSINVFIDGDGFCYAICKAPDGCAIVDGYIKVPVRPGSLLTRIGTIDDGVRECLENIFYESKEAAA